MLLNRAEVFKSSGVDCRLSLYFYEDGGALSDIMAYVASRGLGTHVQFADRIEADRYDCVVSIDTPEVLQANLPYDKVVFECHTTYHESRRYLNELPGWVKVVLIPSESAKAEIAERYPLLREKLRVLSNCCQVAVAPDVRNGSFWGKRPLLHLGRVDSHKNATEVLDLLKRYQEMYGDDLFLLLVGPVEKDVDLDAEIGRRGLAGRVVVLPPVAFDRVPQVFSLVKAHGGIFVSASKGESFGLSAAEALSSGLPVLLSGIPAHLELVQRKMEYVYRLGDVQDGVRKLWAICSAYDQAAHDAHELGKQFSAGRFLSDWYLFLQMLSK